MAAGTPDRRRAETELQRERARFADEHPESRRLFERAKHSLLNGVPMNWMTKWATPFPIFGATATDCTILDVDGHRYLDLCLGDTAAFYGHSPRVLADAVADRLGTGVAFMMPTEDAIWVGEALQRWFGLKYWQIAMTATDANRFAIRLARAITGRHKVLVFNGSYHGSLVETLVELRNGQVVPNADSVGPECDPKTTTRIVEFNDLEALDQALAAGDVACVLAEPALTNCGLVLPDAGFHDGLREITRRRGSLLLIDETHTICTAAGGFTRAHGLQPDILTIGKSIAGGIPGAAFGFSEETAGRIDRVMDTRGPGIYAVGGTLAGNALSLRALRVTLESLMTEAAFVRMDTVAARIESGVADGMRRHGLPWSVQRLGACVAYRLHASRPHNGGEAMVSADSLLDALLHIFFVNRRVLITPFQGMALVSPQTTDADADHHSRVFEEFAKFFATVVAG